MEIARTSGLGMLLLVGLIFFVVCSCKEKTETEEAPWLLAPKQEPPPEQVEKSAGKDAVEPPVVAKVEGEQKEQPKEGQPPPEGEKPAAPEQGQPSETLTEITDLVRSVKELPKGPEKSVLYDFETIIPTTFRDMKNSKPVQKDMGVEGKKSFAFTFADHTQQIYMSLPLGEPLKNVSNYKNICILMKATTPGVLLSVGIFSTLKDGFNERFNSSGHKIGSEWAYVKIPFTTFKSEKNGRSFSVSDFSKEEGYFDVAFLPFDQEHPSSKTMEIFVDEIFFSK